MSKVNKLSRSVQPLAVSALMLLGSQANAAAYPTFTVDFDQSSISVTTAGCISNCGVTGSFTQTGEQSIQFDYNWDQIVLDDILRFDFLNASAFSSGLYDIVVNLVFTSPDAETSSSLGSGILTTFYGAVSVGLVAWDSVVKVINFDQGSTLLAKLEGGSQFGFGPYIETDITLIAKDLVAMNAPSPAPVPPALPVMLLALGGMVYMGRRKRASLAAA